MTICEARKVNLGLSLWNIDLQSQIPQAQVQFAFHLRDIIAVSICKSNHLPRNHGVALGNISEIVVSKDVLCLPNVFLKIYQSVELVQLYLITNKYT